MSRILGLNADFTGKESVAAATSAAAFASLVAAAVFATIFAVAAAFVVAAAAFDMHVTVMELFFGGFADIEDLHVEMKGFSRERMIGVDGDFIAGYIDHGDDLGTVIAVGFELHSRGHFDVLAEVFLRDLEDEAFVPFAVGFDRRNDAGHAVADNFAFEVFFQARYDVIVAVEIDQGLTAVGRIQELSCGVTETIVNSDDLVFLNIHILSFRAVCPAIAAVRARLQPADPIAFIL